MKAKHWYDYLWVYAIIYFALGFFNILFAWLPCNQIAQCWAKVRSSKGIRQRLEAAMSGPEKVSAGRAIGKLEHIECMQGESFCQGKRSHEEKNRGAGSDDPVH